MDPTNNLNFSTNLNTAGTASYGISRSAMSGDSFIENQGYITRSGAGTYQIDLPIQNLAGTNYSAGTLDLESNLLITGTSANKTAGNSVDQEGGVSWIAGGATLTCQGFLMNGGSLKTSGANAATIAAANGFAGTLLTVNGGTIKLAADNPALYGVLVVQGAMNWTGGTYQAYVNGDLWGQTSELYVTGALTLQATAHLRVSVVGQLDPPLRWVPVWYGNRMGELSFDNANQFSFGYTTVGQEGAIYVSTQ